MGAKLNNESLRGKIEAMKKGDELYFKKNDKDITSITTTYNIKGIVTTRLICFNARNSKIEKIVKITKK